MQFNSGFTDSFLCLTMQPSHCFTGMSLDFQSKMKEKTCEVHAWIYKRAHVVGFDLSEVGRMFFVWKIQQGWVERLRTYDHVYCCAV